MQRRCVKAFDEGSRERPGNRQLGLAYADLLPEDKSGDRNICIGRAESSLVRTVVINCHDDEPALRSAVVLALRER